MHESLRSCELYEQLIEGVPDAIVVVDRHGRIALVNRQVEALLGFARDELVGASMELLVPERLRERHARQRSAFARHPAARSMGSGLRLVARRKDGSEVMVEISLGPMVVSGQSLTAAIIRDVTERRSLEAASQRTTWYLRSAVESIGDAFALLDEDDRVVLVNSAARELFDAALSVPSESTSLYAIIDTSLRCGMLEGDPDEVRRRWLDYHGAPKGSLDLHARGGRTLRVTERRTAEGGAVILVADVSEDIHRARELERAREQAVAANAAKTDFLASMSHELRTPLNAILGVSQLLQRDRRSPLDERQRERVAHVVRGGEHLLKLIDDVLDLARIETGRVIIDLGEIDVTALFDEVRNALEPMAASHDTALVAVVAHDVGAVHADRTRLAQILMNFGSNAVKYGRSGGHATFRASARDERVRLAVSDDGIGIPLAHHRQIFEPFQRAGQETGPIEGTGIGLTISKRLADLMGITIGFTSEVGRGSEFWVDVPRVTPALRSAVRLRVGRAPFDPSVPRRLVLYVEDNPSNVAFMRAAIEERADLDLVVLGTAEEAMAFIGAQRPALVVMDLNLPGMSGIEATRRLTNDPATAAIPVVALTAAAMPRDAERASSAGFARCLTKPIDVDLLMQALDELVAARS